MWFIKHPIVLLYKGYKSSANYDGEPSVSKGIVSQLPSSHLSIHRVPAKLSNRVMPYGENYCKLQLLFVFDFTDLLTFIYHFSSVVFQNYYILICLFHIPPLNYFHNNLHSAAFGWRHK